MGRLFPEGRNKAWGLSLIVDDDEIEFSNSSRKGKP